MNNNLKRINLINENKQTKRKMIMDDIKRKFISLLCLFYGKEILCQKMQNVCTAMMPFNWGMCYGTEPPQFNTTCNKAIVCQKTFNISVVKNMEPFFSARYVFIDFMLNRCCGPCTKLSTINIFTNYTELATSSIKLSHFVYPVLGRSSAVKLYGYNFLPLLDLPYAYYVTKREEYPIGQLVSYCVHSYALYILCLIMAIISGFIAWIMETWGNEEEFPRPFLIGWFEGFWWSFISMTTVGYGDKTPKSLIARIYSVVWILIGITVFSLLTAIVTTGMQNVIFPKPAEIRGSRVGGLRHRAYEASIVAEHGGIFIDVEDQNFMRGISQLVRMLRIDEINGFILGRHTFMDVCNRMKNLSSNTEGDLKANADFFLHKTVLTEKTLSANKLSYGMLVADDKDYEYFKGYMIDNHNIIEACNSLHLNSLGGCVKNIEHISLLTSNFSFSMTGIIVISIITFICVFGFGFESIRRRKFRIC